MLAYGVDKLAADASKAGVDGFIIVDLPGEQASHFIAAFNANNLSFVPLVTPATTEDRMAKLGELGSGFVYVVSVTGVTGKRDNVAGGNDISAYLATVKKHITLPVVVGFGVSKREHVVAIGEHADGVVVGSAIVAAVTKSGLDAAPDVCAQHVKELVQELTGGTVLNEDKASDNNTIFLIYSFEEAWKASYHENSSETTAPPFPRPAGSGGGGGVCVSARVSTRVSGGRGGGGAQR